MSNLRFPMFTYVTQYDVPDSNARGLSRRQLCWESHSQSPSLVNLEFQSLANKYGETQLCIVLPYQDEEDIKKIDDLIKQLMEPPND